MVPGEPADRRTSVIGPATRAAVEEHRASAGRDKATAAPRDGRSSPCDVRDTLAGDDFSVRAARTASRSALEHSAGDFLRQSDSAAYPGENRRK
jgi:hypothetical protein